MGGGASERDGSGTVTKVTFSRPGGGSAVPCVERVMSGMNAGVFEKENEGRETHGIQKASGRKNHKKSQPSQLQRTWRADLWREKKKLCMSLRFDGRVSAIFCRASRLRQCSNSPGALALGTKNCTQKELGGGPEEKRG